MERDIKLICSIPIQCMIIGFQVFAVVVVGLLGTLVYLRYRGLKK